MSLRLTRAGDYAIRAMIHLGSLPEGGVALKDDVALAEGIPSSFMAKILRQLVKGGLLRSARGVNGGFGLSRGAGEINLLQIVEAIEGPIALTECSPDPEHCVRAHDCPASSVWLEVQRQMTGLLEKTTLEALVSAPRKNKRVVFTITG
jgi:Rrf2 family transcriptional regulator, iron-sulfur cluster assembly transcription factor